MAREIFQDNEFRVGYEKPRLVTDPAKIEECLPLLTQEFSHNKPETFSKKLLAALKVDGAEVFSDPTANPRGADMFVLEEQGHVDAISVAKYYSWDLLKSQLCLQPTIDESGKVTAFRVQSMEGLFADAGLDASRSKVAVELAYNYVDPNSRGKGYGKAMFATRIQRGIELKGASDCILFTMSRGAHIDSGIGVKILEQLMQKERKLQGAQENERITPQGMTVEVAKLAVTLEIPPGINLIEVNKSSRPIVTFAAANQMQFVGLFRDLSPIFAKII